MGKYLHYTCNYPRAVCGIIASNCTMLSTKSVDCPRCRKVIDADTTEIEATVPVPAKEQAR